MLPKVTLNHNPTVPDFSNAKTWGRASTFKALDYWSQLATHIVEVPDFIDADFNPSDFIAQHFDA